MSHSIPHSIRVLGITAAVLLILALGAFLRLQGINWDSNQHLHPDERFITMVSTNLRLPGSIREYFDTASSPLNPYNRGYNSFVYGTFPLFLTRVVGEQMKMTSYDSVHLLGRFLSALFDLGSILMTFFIGRRLYGIRGGLVAALLLSVTVLHIQYSHFWGMETFLVFSLLVALYFALRISENPRWWDYGGMGLGLGLALASKINAALILPIIVLAIGLRLHTLSKEKTDSSPPHLVVVLKLIGGLLLFLVVAVLVFRTAQPYAFQGTTSFDLRPNPQFIKDMESLWKLQDGSADYPPSHQWTNRVPYLFPLENMILWGMGAPLGILAWAGFALALIRLLRHGERKNILILGWVTVLLAYQGGQFLKTMRYFLPMYPALILLASYFLKWLWARSIQVIRFKASITTLAGLTTFVVLLGTLLWAWGFSQIYTRPITRVEASRWIYDNVPPGSTVANEHWDDPLPLRLPGRDAGAYRGISLELYNADNEGKRATLITQLAQTDYIFITSNRLYGSIPRLPMRYPLTTEYYRLLFAEELGFRLAQTITSYPTIFGQELRDDAAEEAFTVYDHPKVLIFQKTPSFSRQKVEQMLGRVSLENVIPLTPVQASRNALLLNGKDMEANQKGGTWSEIFDRGDPANRFPLLVWLFTIEILTLITLPLGFLLFRSLTDRGYLLTKSLGILLVAYLSWLIPSLHLAAYSRSTILASIGAVAAISGIIAFRHRRDILGFLISHRWLIIISEALFLAAFLSFYLIRLANPDLWHPYRGGEKPMDLAYLNAVIKSTYFPPYDPWLSGGYLNYYYFGQVVVGTLIKLTGIIPAISYNLAIPLLFALTVGGAFCIGYNLTAGRAKPDSPRLLWGPALGAGFSAAAFVTVLGNLDGFFQLVEGLKRIGASTAPASLLRIGELTNILAGLGAVLTGGKTMPLFDFWRSSRMMPPSFSITEFPFFSFLFADLHAHLMAIPFAILVLGLSTALAFGAKKESRLADQALPLLMLALSLGAIRIINSWDFPTYFLLSAAVLLLFPWIATRRLSLPSLLRWTVTVVGLYSLSLLLYYPFHQNYQQFYTGVQPSPEKTPIRQYLSIHGTFLFILGSYLVYELYTRFRTLLFSDPNGDPLKLDRPTALLHLAPSVLILISTPLVAFYFIKLPLVVLLVSFFAVIVFLLYSNLVAPFLSPSRAMVLLLTALGLSLSIGVEFLTIKGDIGRMNTVFKFYLQIWVLFALASAFGLWHIWRHVKAISVGRVWLWAVILLVGASLVYPLAATPVRIKDRFVPLPFTDDGMAYMKQATYNDQKGSMDLRWDYQAILWLQDNVRGSPVILEGSTPLYRWGSRISINTGLPTVIGWDWHQKQQRGVYQWMVDSRLADVNRLYSVADPPSTIKLLRKYGVKYIYVGELERLYYPGAGLQKLDAMVGSTLDIVYQNGPIKIYRVRD